QVAVDLLVDRRRREAVPRVLAAEAAGEIHVLAAVDVPDARALGTRHDQRRRRDSMRDVPLAGGDDTFGLGALLDGHGLLLQVPEDLVRRPDALGGAAFHE